MQHINERFHDLMREFIERFGDGEFSIEGARRAVEGAKEAGHVLSQAERYNLSVALAQLTRGEAESAGVRGDVELYRAYDRGLSVNRQLHELPVKQGYASVEFTMALAALEYAWKLRMIADEEIQMARSVLEGLVNKQPPEDFRATPKSWSIAFLQGLYWGIYHAQNEGYLLKPLMKLSLRAIALTFAGLGIYQMRDEVRAEQALILVNDIVGLLA